MQHVCQFTKEPFGRAAFRSNYKYLYVIGDSIQTRKILVLGRSGDAQPPQNKLVVANNLTFRQCGFSISWTVLLPTHAKSVNETMSLDVIRLTNEKNKLAKALLILFIILQC